MSIPRLIATREASALFGVTTRTVARWVEDGILTPAAQAPGSHGAYLFDAEQVEALAAERFRRAVAAAAPCWTADDLISAVTA